MAGSKTARKKLTHVITVNGSERRLSEPMGLVQFLESLGVDLQFIAVAYNGEVLRREQYEAIALKDGDALEIVRPMGGG